MGVGDSQEFSNRAALWARGVQLWPALSDWGWTSGSIESAGKLRGLGEMR